MIARDRHAVTGTGERLDRQLLRLYPWLDRATVRDLIAAGHVRINQRTARKGKRLEAGDLVECRDIPEPADLRLQPNPGLPLRIVYEDDTLLALDKPAGMPTHPLRHSETETLANALLALRPEVVEVSIEKLFPSILHRLDTQTSGLVLAAKTTAAYVNLREQFRRFTVQKHYTALVHGLVDSPGSLDAPLTHQTRTPCKMAVVRKPDKAPKNDCFAATTSWVPLETGREFSLIDVTIYTGVTHQIRCHLAAAGHPIAGDTLYGAPVSPSQLSVFSPPPSGLPRHWLHAARLICTHPATGRSLDVSAPLPPDWPTTR